MCSVALPEMRRYRYADSLSTGSIAAGGTLGIMIPPSIIFVIYGIMTEQSIGKLLMSGVLPGIVETLLFVGAIAAVTAWSPALGAPGPARPCVSGCSRCATSGKSACSSSSSSAASTAGSPPRRVGGVRRGGHAPLRPRQAIPDPSWTAGGAGGDDPHHRHGLLHRDRGGPLRLLHGAVADAHAAGGVARRDAGGAGDRAVGDHLDLHSPGRTDGRAGDDLAHGADLLSGGDGDRVRPHLVRRRHRGGGADRPRRAAGG